MNIRKSLALRLRRIASTLDPGVMPQVIRVPEGALDEIVLKKGLFVSTDALERVMKMDATQRGTYGMAVRDTLRGLDLITPDTADILRAQAYS